MDDASKRFARRILLMHVVLLTMVLTIVYFAAREIYYSAREEAISQATSRQDLLSDQTARGIETFYTSVLDDLNWYRHSDGTTSAETPQVPGSAMRLLQQRAGALQPILGKQLEDRTVGLFIYDKPSETVSPFVAAGAEIDPKKVPPEMHAWLKTVSDKEKVSPFMQLDLREHGQEHRVGVTLVCAPVGPLSRRLLVAVVPGEKIEENFLLILNDPYHTSGALVDDTLATMAASNKQLVGLNLNDFDNADLRDLARNFIAFPKKKSKMFDQPITIKGVTLGPRLVTMEPVTVAGNHWALFISSPESDVEDVVNGMFRRAVYWGLFVVISVTAILVSTAVTMIRSRSRLERQRHELLTRELDQARQIQLNWLPDSASAGPSFDIAAVNHPASHISGDFYNWFEFPGGRQVITIGDVTGHGMAAAFLMATTQLLVRNTMVRLGDASKCLEEVNRQLCVQVFSGQFVTMLVLVLDVDRGIVEVVNAGHPPPLISNGDGAFEQMPVSPQLVLGVEEGVRFPAQKFALSPHSSLLLYTDGAIDAQAPGGERFTVEGLQHSLYGRFDTAQAIIDTVVNAVNAFRGERELADDLTLVAIQLQAAGTRPEGTTGAVERRESLTVTTTS